MCFTGNALILPLNIHPSRPTSSARLLMTGVSVPVEGIADFRASLAARLDATPKVGREPA